MIIVLHQWSRLCNIVYSPLSDGSALFAPHTDLCSILPTYSPQKALATALLSDHLLSELVNRLSCHENRHQTATERTTEPTKNHRKTVGKPRKAPLKARKPTLGP